MRAPLVAILALAGCDTVFGLSGREPDAPDSGRICHDTDDQLFHDEDADGSDDGCDLCPGLYTDTVADADQDGVGDPCDPRPSIAGDQIVLFESFAGPLRLDQSWISSGGDWNQTGDALVYSDLDTTAFNRIASMTTPPPAPYVLEMSFDLETTRTATQSAFEIVTEIDTKDPEKPRAIGCGISRDTKNADFVQLDNDYTKVNTKTPAPMLTYRTYVARFSYNPDEDSRCSIDNGDDIHHQAAVAFATPNEEPHPFGLIARQMAVRVRWITIYARE